MKLIFKRSGTDQAVGTEMEREQIIMLGKRIFDCARDLRNGVILLEFTEPDGLELRAFADINGCAPLSMLDTTKLGKAIQ